MIDNIRIESDEDGWYLVLDGDMEEVIRKWFTTPGGYALTIPLPQHAAAQLVQQTRPVAEWLAEGAREFAAYSTASDEERAAVLGTQEYDPDPADLLREGADLARKRERENPCH